MYIIVCVIILLEVSCNTNYVGIVAKSENHYFTQIKKHLLSTYTH